MDRTNYFWVGEVLHQLISNLVICCAALGLHLFTHLQAGLVSGNAFYENNLEMQIALEVEFVEGRPTPIRGYAPLHP